MKLQIDYQEKTITVLNDVSALELIEKIKDIVGNEDGWKVLPIIEFIKETTTEPSPFTFPPTPMPTNPGPTYNPMNPYCTSTTDINSKTDK